MNTCHVFGQPISSYKKILLRIPAEQCIFADYIDHFSTAQEFVVLIFFEHVHFIRKTILQHSQNYQFKQNLIPKQKVHSFKIRLFKNA